MHLRNAPTRLMKDLGYGKDYVYAHDTSDGVAAMSCLPESLAGQNFYRPGRRGFEAELAERMEEDPALARPQVAGTPHRRGAEDQRN